MVKKSRVFWIFFMVLAVFLLSLCSKKKSTEPEPPDKWTILGYFDGNNYQDTVADSASYVIRDVQDMEQVGSNEDVQIIVMLSSINTEGNSNYYFIEKQSGEPPTDVIRSKILNSLGPEDMSNPETLKRFIEYGVENYPADHYMLIINDRGSGWKGVCSDQENGDGEMMSLPELDYALSNYNFEIILFNAPYMSMVEVAYQLKDEANYLVVLESNLLMKNILSASEWLQALANNPGINSKSLAYIVAEAIHTTAGLDNTISVIDLSKMDALTSKIADFDSLLKSNIGDDWKEVLDARKTSPSFPIMYYVDLKKFCQNIQDTSTYLNSTIKSAAQAVENANDVAVVKMLSYPDLGYGGLSIHFPLTSDKFDSTDYVQLAFAVSDSNWHVFLSEFIKAYEEANLLGSLRVTSEPVKGASIYLDGDSTGLVTDTTIHRIREGWHTVKVVIEGYHEAEDQALVIPGQIRTISFWLIPLSPPRESISDLNYR